MYNELDELVDEFENYNKIFNREYLSFVTSITNILYEGEKLVEGNALNNNSRKVSLSKNFSDGSQFIQYVPEKGKKLIGPSSICFKRNKVTYINFCHGGTRFTNIENGPSTIKYEYCSLPNLPKSYVFIWCNDNQIIERKGGPAIIKYCPDTGEYDCRWIWDGKYLTHDVDEILKNEYNNRKWFDLDKDERLAISLGIF